MKAPRELREQFMLYMREGFTPVKAERAKGSHWKVWFAEFTQVQCLTANEGDPRGLKNNIARFRRLSKGGGK